MPRKTLAYSPDGTPRYVRCYDSGGATADRYTCVFTQLRRYPRRERFQFLAMSADPFHPQGVGFHGCGHEDTGPIDRPTSSHLGKRTPFASLPDAVRRCIMNDYTDYWGQERLHGLLGATVTITHDMRTYPIEEHFVRVEHAGQSVTWKLYGDFATCYADSTPMLASMDTPKMKAARAKIWRDFYGLQRALFRIKPNNQPASGGPTK